MRQISPSYIQFRRLPSLSFCQISFERIEFTQIARVSIYYNIGKKAKEPERVKAGRLEHSCNLKLLEDLLT